MYSGIFYCVFSSFSRIPDKISRYLVLLAFSPLLLYTSDTDVQAWPFTILAYFLLVLL